MASIKIKFRPLQRQECEGTLYYQIIQHRMVRQVKTDFRIFECEWSSEYESLVISEDFNRSNYLKAISYRLKCGLQKFERIVEGMGSSTKELSVDELVAFFEKALSSTTLYNYMEILIGNFRNNGQARTAETYQATLNSFKRFNGMCDIPLNELSSDVIESYQYYLKRHNVGMNTVSFYMRRLRATYNRAVENELVPPSHLFKHVYTGMEKTVKRAISKDYLKVIKDLKLVKNKARCYARDMFILSFFLRGMSFVDMAFLQKKDLKDGILTYRRRKTNQKLSIEWEDCMQQLASKYQKDDSPFLIGVLEIGSDEEQRRQSRNVLSNINRNLKGIGKTIGLKAPLTMYVARHSWASIARNMDIPISVISAGLGHDNEVTTSIYLSSVGTEVVDQANRKIIDL